MESNPYAATHLSKYDLQRPQLFYYQVLRRLRNVPGVGLDTLVAKDFVLLTCGGIFSRYRSQVKPILAVPADIALF